MVTKEQILRNLRNLDKNYQAVFFQWKLYLQFLEDLRTLYRENRSSFTKEDVKEINMLKCSISSNFKVNPFLNNHTIKEEYTQCDLKEGMVVIHMHKFYLGVIASKSLRKELFEDKTDIQEYRINISNNEDTFASPKNLYKIGYYVRNKEIQDKVSSYQKEKKYIMDPYDNIMWY